MQAFTPFVRVATDATRHFATFGLAPAAAFFIPNPARHPFQGWARRFIAITHQKQAKARGRWANADRLTSQPQRSGRSISPSTQASELTPTRRSMQPFIHRDHQKHAKRRLRGGHLVLQKSFNAAQASKESHYRSTRIHGTKRTKPTRCIPRTQSKGHGGDEQACGSPIEQGWQHPLQTHHTPQMHADACYPHRRGSRSPSEVHEHTEDGPMPGQRRGRWMPPRQRGHQVHEETEA